MDGVTVGRITLSDESINNDILKAEEHLDRLYLLRDHRKSTDEYEAIEKFKEFVDQGFTIPNGRDGFIAGYLAGRQANNVV